MITPAQALYVMRCYPERVSPEEAQESLPHLIRDVQPSDREAFVDIWKDTARAASAMAGAGHLDAAMAFAMSRNPGALVSRETARKDHEAEIAQDPPETADNRTYHESVARVLREMNGTGTVIQTSRTQGWIVEVSQITGTGDLHEDDLGPDGECKVDGSYLMSILPTAEDRDLQPVVTELFDRLEILADADCFDIVVRRATRPEIESRDGWLRQDLGTYSAAMSWTMTDPPEMVLPADAPAPGA